jgi:predicted metal-binding membrane protein
MAMHPTSTHPVPGTAVFRHAPVWFGMAAVAAASWFYLLWMDRNMAAMDGNSMAPMAMAMQSGGFDLLLPSLAMWAVMMLAMMLPTVVPSTALYSNLAAKRNATSGNRATAMYVAGYSVCWILFAAPAAALQTVLTTTSLLDSMAQSTSALMSAAILFAAGLYQFSPLKTACLSKCRSPLGFFMAKWRDGVGGALALGIQHGGYCVGCCWALMAVMFVVGAMNLAWMGALTLLVLSEKVIPPAWRVDRITGMALVMSGLWMGASAWAGL